MSTELKEYFVSKRASAWVAGKRNPGAGKPIKLSEAQAVTPLRNGEVFKTKADMEANQKKHDDLVAKNKRADKKIEPKEPAKQQNSKAAKKAEAELAAGHRKEETTAAAKAAAAAAAQKSTSAEPTTDPVEEDAPETDESPSGGGSKK